MNSIYMKQPRLAGLFCFVEVSILEGHNKTI